ncbi:hypothetical protein J6590_056044 [Homalodisca vitripennis]|nr:hypothetical protein J6590_056044 [Homalodisca vitripennis]
MKKFNLSYYGAKLNSVFQDYEPILNRQRSGCFAVPMVHSSVLVSMQTTQADNLHFDPQLVEGYNGPHDDIITFARSANLSGVPLFVCNDQVYGYVMVPLEKDDSLDYDKLQLTNLKVEIMGECSSVIKKLIVCTS